MVTWRKVEWKVDEIHGRRCLRSGPGSSGVLADLDNRDLDQSPHSLELHEPSSVPVGQETGYVY